jgi:4-hydroxy-2-oxoheptanedioate aldolase
MAYENPLKAIWKAGRTSYGGWTGSPDPVIAEWMASSGFDEVLVDQQHGAIEPNQLGPIFTAISARGVIPTTRVAVNDFTAIGKSLDLGAQAIVVPMVNNRAEAAAVVTACRYPPRGMRSMGPIRQHLVVESEEVDDLETPAVIVMVETADGLANVDEIASTPGVDAIYVGPADLGIALGIPWNRANRTKEQQAQHDGAVERIRQACDRAGIVAGMNCSNGEIAGNYVAQGFRMVTVTTDADIIPRDGARELARAKEIAGKG